MAKPMNQPNAAPRRILLVAGEASGDLHGAHLVRALRERAPDVEVWAVAGELSGHRGQIKGSDTPRPGTVQITAQAPLSELEHFPARLKSLTAGHGSYSMEFSHYEPAPPQLQQKLAAAHKPQAEAE